MKNKIIFIFLLSISIVNLKASPQAPDYLIIGNDTLPVYKLILEDYLNSVEQPADSNSLFGFKFKDEFGYGISMNCWRGYQAVYNIENDSLFLKYIIPCNSFSKLDDEDIKRSNEQMQKIFQEKVKNNKVFMDWYSGDFTIPKGSPIWRDGLFTTIYDKEDLYSIRKGYLADKHTIDNYLKMKGGIPRKKQKMSKAIFNEIKKLDWKKLDRDLPCDDRYNIEIDSRGKVINVEKNNYGMELDKDDVHCQNIIKKQLEKLQFDVILHHGMPFNEIFYIEIFYDSTTGKLENWSQYEDDEY